VRIQVLTLRYSAARGGFDDGPLDELVRARHVLSVSEHFFSVDEVPHLACVVRWQEGDEGGAGTAARPTTAGRRKRPARPDPAADLDEARRAGFESLRAWRRERARTEGLPAYNVLTDRQLVAIVRARPQTLEELEGIEEVGPGKARLFGEQLLAACVHAAAETERAATARGDGGA
jgi:superfamily II DNA helicase RecQ